MTNRKRILLTGASTESSSDTYSYTASDGVLLSGVATTNSTLHKEYTASEGIKLSGVASVNKNKEFLSTGGIKLSSNAVTSFVVPISSYTGTGQLSIGGIASTEKSRGYVYPSSGGVLFSSVHTVSLVKDYRPYELLPYDIYWSSVDFLAHFDISLYYDSSDFSRNIYQGGTPSLSTTEGKYGSSSWKANSSFVSYFYISVGTDYQFGEDDWTIEISANHFNTPVNYQGYLFYRSGGSSHLKLFVDASKIEVLITEFGGDTAYISYTVGLDTGNWHDVAIERYGSSIGLYYDGILVGEDTFTGALNIASSSIYFNGITGYSLRAYIDEVRITRGIARYQHSSYTPATSTFPEALVPPSTYILLEGAADVRDNNYEGTGGLYLNGFSDLAIAKVYSSSGIITLGGYAQTSGIFSVHLVGIGGIVINGSASYSKILNESYIATGGILASGNTIYELINFDLSEYTATGGLLVAGNSISSRNAEIGSCIATGGAFISRRNSDIVYPAAVFNNNGCLYRTVNKIGDGSALIISEKTFSFYTRILVESGASNDIILSLDKTDALSPHFYIGLYSSDRNIKIVGYMGNGAPNFLTYTISTLPLQEWAELYVTVDTTKAIENERIRIYIDGVEATKNINSTYPAQNTSFVNGTSTHTYAFAVGGSSVALGYFLTGKLASTIYIDGLNLPVGSIEDGFDGPYGAYGWHLTYENNLSLGYDASPNG